MMVSTLPSLTVSLLSFSLQTHLGGARNAGATAFSTSVDSCDQRDSSGLPLTCHTPALPLANLCHSVAKLPSSQILSWCQVIENHSNTCGALCVCEPSDKRQEKTTHNHYTWPPLVCKQDLLLEPIIATSYNLMNNAAHLSYNTYQSTTLHDKQTTAIIVTAPSLFLHFFFFSFFFDLACDQHSPALKQLPRCFSKRTRQDMAGSSALPISGKIPYDQAVGQAPQSKAYT